MPRYLQRVSRLAVVVSAIVFFQGITTRASTLADAAERADWNRLEELLSAKPDINAAQPDGCTALHWAVFHESAKAVKALLDAGADVSLKNRYDIPPLHLACVNGNRKIVRMLLKNEADSDTVIRGGQTVLMTAARTGRTGPLKALIKHGADVNAIERRGQTALMWAAADGHAKAVELLVKSGADSEKRLRSGFTAFLFAARNGHLDVVRSLLKAGVEPDSVVRTERGGGRMARNGTSALLLAVENGHFELALALVEAGADPNDQRSGYTPLHVVSWVRKPNRGDDPSGMPAPHGSGNVTSLEFVRRIVAAGANVNARLKKGPSGRGRLNEKGATPYLFASRTADLPLMKLLVELKADPLIPNADDATPLMASAGLGCLAPTEVAGTENECLAAVGYNLSLGAEINHVDENGETAMHGAAYKSLPKVVDQLAENGAKIDVWLNRNRYGWTPVMIAEGFRPGNFKPSAETLAALHNVIRAAGREPPPSTPRPAVGRKGYENR